MVTRCGWVTTDPLYIDYHDHEWGIPCRDGLRLFEMLCLEGQQAGLSWITVLKKRQHYRHCFSHFVPQQIAMMGPEDVEHLMQDSGLIRHRLKINAIITNAHAYLTMQEKGEDFATFIWSFVNGQPQEHQWASLAEVPTRTAISDAMSKALKKRGFAFTGSTICYAFMQACGLVNDHQQDCVCRITC